MGAMWHAIIRARKPEKPAPVLASLAEFLEKDKRHARVFDQEFVGKWQEFIEAFRNKAAHSEAMSPDDAEACRHMLFATEDSLFRVLCQ